MFLKVALCTKAKVYWGTEPPEIRRHHNEGCAYFPL